MSQVYRLHRAAIIVAAGAVVGSLASVNPAAAAPPSGPEVVITGLNNPRGLTFDNTGTLYVSEAGVGGHSKACLPNADNPAGPPVCYGPTSSILAFPHATSKGDPTASTYALVSGMPSLAQEDDPGTSQVETGTQAVGIDDVSVAPDGTVYFPVGLGSAPKNRAKLLTAHGAPGQKFASLFKVESDGQGLKKVADLGDYEAAHNPDKSRRVPQTAVPDTNPYSVLARRNGSVLVADAGADDVLTVDPGSGKINKATVLPPLFPLAPPMLHAPAGTRIPDEAVPTSLAARRDGTTYVGQLTGFPFPVGGSTVYTLGFSHVEPYAGGFTNVVDVAVGPDGNLYVLEIAHQSLLAGPVGALYRVSDNGATKELLADHLFAPGGIAFGPDNMAYVTVCSVCTGSSTDPHKTGSVVRIDAVHAPALLTITDDTAITSEDAPVDVKVLANDSQGATGPLHVSRVPDPDQGVAVAADGSVRYTPAAQVHGHRRVVYQACDSQQHCAQGVLDVRVKKMPTDRVAGSNRTATAVRVSQAVFPYGASAVVIARSNKYPDALAGSVLAAVAGTPPSPGGRTGGPHVDSGGPPPPSTGVPLLLTRSNTLSAATAAEINRLGATTAYILGGDAAIGPEVVAALGSKTGIEHTVRVGGKNRYATAAKIRSTVAHITHEPTRAAYIASGQRFADAMSVEALAAHQVRPILLTRKGTLPKATANALAAAGKTVDVTLVGGTEAVSTHTAATIDKLAGTVDRLAGSDRYATSVAVTKAAVQAGLKPTLAWLTTGTNWPDGVAAGSAVAQDQATLLLVNPNDLARSAATSTYLGAHKPFVDVDLLGGKEAISPHVESQIRAVIAAN